MNARERHLDVMLFRQPDRVPITPGYGRRSTRQRWHDEGMPADVTDPARYVLDQLGVARDPGLDDPQVHPGINFNMIPEFEEKVILVRADSQVVQDWKGNICEIGLEFSPSDLRGAPDFCTRSWLSCPVTGPDDWPDMQRRYDPDDPGRFPDDWPARVALLGDRRYLAGLTISGPFWQMREWMGFEHLCMAMLDQPDFIDRIAGFWRDFVAAMLQRVMRDWVPDFVMINEDMAYKEKPMIGPAMARRFCGPCWRRWSQICRDAGVPVFEVDSDGCIDELMEPWIECGFVANSPVEVAAGNDLPALRQQYGERMAYRGGVDKRAIAAGGATIQREIDRLRPVIEAGGYIPGCDHAIPHDVSWRAFNDYCRLLAKATGWL